MLLEKTVHLPVCFPTWKGEARSKTRARSPDSQRGEASDSPMLLKGYFLEGQRKSPHPDMHAGTVEGFKAQAEGPLALQSP